MAGTATPIPAPPSSTSAGGSSSRADPLRAGAVLKPVSSVPCTVCKRQETPHLPSVRSVDAEQALRLSYLLHAAFLVTSLDHIARLSNKIGWLLPATLIRLLCERLLLMGRRRHFPFAGITCASAWAGLPCWLPASTSS